VAAAEAGAGRAEVALERIRQRCALEGDLPLLLPPSGGVVTQEQRGQREDQRRQRRQQQAEPVLAALKSWLDEQRPQALPKPPLGQALGDALNNGAALKRYLGQGYRAIGNSLSERTLRAIALGRNNWGQLGSETGGRTAAVLDTAVGTCKHLGIDPFLYLRETLPALFALGEEPQAEQLLDWLPDRWLLRRGRESPGGAAQAG
jgi:transposase